MFLPKNLQEVQMPIVNNTVCTKAYTGKLGSITNNMICAGLSEGGKDICMVSKSKSWGIHLWQCHVVKELTCSITACCICRVILEVHWWSRTMDIGFRLGSPALSPAKDALLLIYLVCTPESLNTMTGLITRSAKINLDLLQLPIMVPLPSSVYFLLSPSSSFSSPSLCSSNDSQRKDKSTIWQWLHLISFNT